MRDPSWNATNGGLLSPGRAKRVGCGSHENAIPIVSLASPLVTVPQTHVGPFGTRFPPIIASGRFVTPTHMNPTAWCCHPNATARCRKDREQRVWLNAFPSRCGTGAPTSIARRSPSASRSSYTVPAFGWSYIIPTRSTPAYGSTGHA